MSDKRGSKTDHPAPGILGVPCNTSDKHTPAQADSGVGITRLDDGKVRTFPTGATRDTEAGKLDFEAFLSPAVLRRYAEYMHEHRKRSDGTMRDGDDWQKGMPTEVYAKSLIRHVMDVWLWGRGYEPVSGDGIENLLCAVVFNAMGILHNIMD